MRERIWQPRHDQQTGPKMQQLRNPAITRSQEKIRTQKIGLSPLYIIYMKVCKRVKNAQLYGAREDSTPQNLLMLLLAIVLCF